MRTRSPNCLSDMENGNRTVGSNGWFRDLAQKDRTTGGGRLPTTERDGSTRLEGRPDYGFIPIASEAGQRREMRYQGLPTHCLFVKRPDPPAHFDIAADQVRRDLVALVEDDGIDLGER